MFVVYLCKGSEKGFHRKTNKIDFSQIKTLALRNVASSE